jgi:hypothetical protein
MPKKIVQSHWIFQGEPLLDLPQDCPGGFIYEITNLITGQKYIGKKNCFSTTRKPPLKGKKRKRVVTRESDWKTYKSSSKVLKAQINEYGIKNFNFEILIFSPDKAQNNFAELVYQIKMDVLQAMLPNGTRKYLNENIGMRYYHSDKYSLFRESLDQL